MSDIVHEVLPQLHEILGPSRHLDTLRFTIWDHEAYYPVTGDLVMTPIVVDRDSITGDPLPNSVRWDNTFVHEMTHAILEDDLGVLRWMSEGIAEAARFFVAEAMERAGSPRRMMDPRTPLHIALADAYDRCGIELSGGTGWYPLFRANGEAVYRGAAAAIMLPCFAEIAAGQVSPHPLRRLADAMAYEAGDRRRYSAWHAVDSAWASPIDGGYPPSRWLGMRSVTWSEALPDDAHLAVLTESPSTPVNPARLQLFAYNISRNSVPVRKIVAGRMTFTAADGGEWQSVSREGVSEVPPLPLGAYRVDAEAATEWPHTPIVRGRNWIIVTSTGRPLLDSSEGIAIIFADSCGKPIDLPEVTVNGRIVERVPGGIIVASDAASEIGMLTLHAGGRTLGSVTVPGRFSRTVVLTVDEAPALPMGPISWLPYRPKPGDSLAVHLRRDETFLDPASTSVTLVLMDQRDGAIEEHPMRRTAGPGDLWVGRVRMTADRPVTRLGFLAGRTRIMPDGWVQHEVRLIQAGTASISGAEWDGRTLVLIVEGTAEHGSLGLQHFAPGGTGDWIDIPARPVRVDGDPLRLRFDLAGVDGWVRVVFRDSSIDRVLMTLRVPSEPDLFQLSTGLPFPNPCGERILWMVDAGAPAVSELRVYDASGRLAAGPIERRLLQGPQVVSWDRAALSSLPAGVYFLKLTAEGAGAVRRVVVLPGAGR